MRIGVVVKAFAAEPPFESAIRRAAELGFVGVSLACQSPEQLERCYDRQNNVRTRELTRSLGLEIAEFMFTPPGLTGKRREDRNEGLKSFERACEKASELGASVVSSESHTAFEGPGFAPKYAFIDLLKLWGDPVFRIEMPEGFDWNNLWGIYVHSIGRCVDIADEHGLRFALEPHPFQIVGSTDAWLRMYDAVRNKSLGVCFDTSHIIQRGDIPEVALHILRDHIYSVHFSDNDGLMGRRNSYLSQHLTLGKGKVDWEGVLKTLKTIGYDGFLMLELTDVAREILDQELLRSRALIHEYAKKVGIPLN